MDSENEFEHPFAYKKNFQVAVDAPIKAADDTKFSPSPLRFKVDVVGGRNRRSEEEDEAFDQSKEVLHQLATAAVSTYIESGKTTTSGVGQEFSQVTAGEEKKVADCVIKDIDKVQRKRKRNRQLRFTQLRRQRNRKLSKARKKNRETLKNIGQVDIPDDSPSSSSSSSNKDSSSEKESFSHQESSASPSDAESTEESDEDVEIARITMSFERKVVGKQTAEELRKKRERREKIEKRKKKLKSWSKTDFHLDSKDIDETDESYDDPYTDRTKPAYAFEGLDVKTVDDIKFRKKFLLYQVLNQLFFLKSNIYNRLKPGIYYCFGIITKKQMITKGWYMWTRRFPFSHQGWVMLTYDVTNEEFFLLLPSQPTRRDVNVLRKMQALDDENMMLVIEKEENVWQSWNHPKPKWTYCLLSDCYPSFCQFVVHQCSEFMDAKAGRTMDMKVLTSDVHKAFVEKVEAEIEGKDLRNWLMYEQIYYSPETEQMVSQIKEVKSFRHDWMRSF